MAIIKFLKSSSTFNGVTYNESRVKQGEAELLAARNFSSDNFLFSMGCNYQDYLTLWSSKNSNVKKPQLHVTISCKGQELDKTQLLDIADKWMNKMGYNGVPYLVYYHNNTKNNHIHIVSSRIDAYGNKINDKYEGVRGLKCLNEILGFDNTVKIRNEIASLLRYSFDTIHQFFEFCNKNGFDIKKEDDSILLKKSGTSVRINLELIESCMKKYKRKFNAGEKKKIQALIYKYAQMFDRDSFIKFMKDNFGYEFIFYGKNNTLNGYTFIDYKNRIAVKGSSLISLKKLSELFSVSEKSKLYNSNLLVRNLLRNSRFMTSFELSLKLAEYGLLYNDGRFFDLKDNSCYGKLDDQLYKKICLNDEMYKIAHSYSPTSLNECFVLAKLFDVNPYVLNKMVSSSNISKKDLTVYSSFIKNCLDNGQSLKDCMSYLNMECYKYNNQFVFVDIDNENIFSAELLDLDSNQIQSNLSSYTNVSFSNMSNYSEDLVDGIEEEDTNDISQESNLIGSINIAVSGSKPKKKKK